MNVYIFIYTHIYLYIYIFIYIFICRSISIYVCIYYYEDCHWLSQYLFYQFSLEDMTEGITDIRIISELNTFPES